MMIEKNKNPFEVLPMGWISFNHRSGIPLYLHKASRVVTASRPYYIGKYSVVVGHLISSQLEMILGEMNNLLKCFTETSSTVCLLLVILCPG
jgi:hypothetical protein